MASAQPGSSFLIQKSASDAALALLSTIVTAPPMEAQARPTRRLSLPVPVTTAWLEGASFETGYLTTIG